MNLISNQTDNLTRLTCDDLPLDPLNSTDVSDLMDYCDFRENIMLTMSKVNIVFSAFGVISGALILATITSNKDFNDPCFICYQALAITQFLYAIVRITNYVEAIKANLGRDFRWSYWRYIAANALYGVFLYSDVIIIAFLSFQRFVACTMPLLFNQLNRKFVYVLVVVCAYLFISIPTSVPVFFVFYISWSNESEGYNWHTKHLKGIQIYFDFYTYYTTVQAAIIFASAILAIAGVTKVTIRRWYLVRQRRMSAGNSESINSSKRCMQLCFLQLCLIMPSFINRFVVLMLYEFYHKEYVYDARGHIILSHSYWHTWFTVVDHALDCFSRYCSFYLYMAFSQTFRNGFKKRLLCISD